MAKLTAADDILPLIAGLTPLERVRLIPLITEQPDVDEAAVYSAAPPCADEFSSDEESLAWEAEGCEKTLADNRPAVTR